MKKILLLLITFLAVAAGCVDMSAQTRARKSTKKKATTSATVKQRQRDNKKAIKETSKKIETNRREIQKRLYDLDVVTADIKSLDKEITSLKASVAALDGRIKAVDDSVAALDSRLSSMSAKYGSAVRRIYSRNRNATSNLAFIFSANTVGEAYRRSRSLEQFAKWRKRKAEEIDNLKKELAVQRQSLFQLKQQRSSQLAELNNGMATLKRRKEESDRLVTVLKRQERQLKTVLGEKEREAAALESELQRLIAQEQQRALEEQRKKEEAERKAREEEQQRLKAAREKELLAAAEKPTPEKTVKQVQDKPEKAVKETQKPVEKPKVNKPEKKVKKEVAPDIRSVGGDFASNRGRITFPVAGQYRIVKPFGRSKHPELKYVETDNPGIDIETSKGADVRASFDGKVSDIFRLPGYNTIVMIRHGNYLTVYANLGSITVKKGDTVKNGQVIGTVYSDPDNDGRSILHFEIRNEKAKENPENWLAMR